MNKTFTEKQQERLMALGAILFWLGIGSEIRDGHLVFCDFYDQKVTPFYMDQVEKWCLQGRLQTVHRTVGWVVNAWADISCGDIVPEPYKDE